MSAIKQPLLFQDVGARRVQADFSGGHLTVDAGVLLLRQVNRGLGVSRRLAACFHDHRQPEWVEHSVEQLLDQRLYGLALGYEDLHDHARLRLDPLLAVACDKRDPLGRERVRPEHRGVALASAATLNRLELSNNKATSAHKLPHDPAQITACLLELGVASVPRYAREIILDLDAMGHRLHGTQEGRHFNAYYDDYCYLPLYVCVGDLTLWAQLRTCERSAADGVVPALEQIIRALRKRCRHARIIVRGDSGFGVEAIMAWCERQTDVYYCLGIGQHAGLLAPLGPALAAARARHCLTGVTTRAFAEFTYQTKTSWSRARRVIGKAEVMSNGDNPRFIVTNLPTEAFPEDDDQARFTPTCLYEGLYCARGEMENVLKQQVLDLHADRLSTHHLASNQLRLWLAAFAYLLLERVRALGLAGTQLAQATAGTIRLHLLKVAAQVTVSVRRVYVQMNSAFPLQPLFRLCQQRLTNAALWSG